MDELLNKYLAGDTNKTENRQVYEWIRQSPENEKYFKELRRLHDIVIWRDDVTLAPVARKRNQRQYIDIFIRIAAVFLMAVGIFYFYRQSADNSTGVTAQKNDTEMREINVSTGEYVELVLDDGTKVWLNSKSTFTYPPSFTDSERVVRLVGEGYFDVTHDPDRPFKVETQEYSIQVLGTEFDVRAYAGSQPFETSLLKGSVMIRSGQSSENLYLKPYERASVTDEGGLQITSFTEDEFLWREGILFIDNKTIREILPVLEQYFDVKFIIEGNITGKHKKYIGKFRVQDGVEHILHVLQINIDTSEKTNMIKIIVDPEVD